MSTKVVNKAEERRAFWNFMKWGILYDVAVTALFVVVYTVF